VAQIIDRSTEGDGCAPRPLPNEAHPWSQAQLDGNDTTAGRGAVLNAQFVTSRPKNSPRQQNEFELDASTGLDQRPSTQQQAMLVYS